MKIIFSSLLVLTILFSFSSCKKIEGPGGTSKIVGKLHALQRDGFGNITVEYDLADEDVFIIYGGENTMYDDDQKTSYDGSFRFDYLEEGTYQIFVYEKCLAGECESGERVKLIEVEITDKKSTVDIGTINVFK